MASKSTVSVPVHHPSQPNHNASGKPSATLSRSITNKQAELDALVKEYMNTIERQRELKARIDVLMREREAEIETKMQNMAKEKLALRNIHEELRGKLHRAGMDEHSPPPAPAPPYLPPGARLKTSLKAEKQHQHQHQQEKQQQEEYGTDSSSSSDDLAESPRRPASSPTRRVFPVRPRAGPNTNYMRPSGRHVAGLGRLTPPLLPRGRPTTANPRYNPY
ncbi:hypothetical protein FRC19_003644 [Serendipita sp. 401]|nr:hypothetical protein FRC19_003644 [Serendipita sp. 401]KAG9042223.1 hypothetical protein FS842_002266 [Serendipita sp. 407]